MNEKAWGNDEVQEEGNKFKMIIKRNPPKKERG